MRTVLNTYAWRGIRTSLAITYFLLRVVGQPEWADRIRIDSARMRRRSETLPPWAEVATAAIAAASVLATTQVF